MKASLPARPASRLRVRISAAKLYSRGIAVSGARRSGLGWMTFIEHFLRWSAPKRRSRSRSLVGMVYSENRRPLFPDHARWAARCPPLAHKRHYAADGIWPQLDRQTGCQASGIAL